MNGKDIFLDFDPPLYTPSSSPRLNMAQNKAPHGAFFIPGLATPNNDVIFRCN